MKATEEKQKFIIIAIYMYAVLKLYCNTLQMHDDYLIFLLTKQQHD